MVLNFARCEDHLNIKIVSVHIQPLICLVVYLETAFGEFSAEFWVILLTLHSEFTIPAPVEPAYIAKVLILG